MVRKLIKGVEAQGRGKAYHRRGLWAIKKKNGGKFPTHAKKEKAAEAPAKKVRPCPLSRIARRRHRQPAAIHPIQHPELLSDRPLRVATLGIACIDKRGARFLRQIPRVSPQETECSWDFGGRRTSIRSSQYRGLVELAKVAD